VCLPVKYSRASRIIVTTRKLIVTMLNKPTYSPHSQCKSLLKNNLVDSHEVDLKNSQEKVTNR
jgi:hypothetical protein